MATDRPKPTPEEELDVATRPKTEKPRSAVAQGGPAMGDRAETIAYFYRDDITTAVNVALATDRQLLVSGPSGCGTTTLAGDIGRVLGWSVEREVITSRSQAVGLQ